MFAADLVDWVIRASLLLAVGLLIVRMDVGRTTGVLLDRSQRRVSGTRVALYFPALPIRWRLLGC
jgi:hypothetical protein